LHLQSRLDSGIYRDDQEAVESWDVELPCGPRNFLKISRMYYSRLHNLCVSYGSIGAGNTRLFATTEDEQEYDIEPVEDTYEAMNAIARLMAQVKQVMEIPN